MSVSAPLGAFALAERLTGRASSPAGYQGWEGLPVDLDPPVPCPKDASEMAAARGVGEDQRFLFFCAACPEVFSPVEIGLTDEQVASMTSPSEEAPEANDKTIGRSLRDRYEVLASQFDDAQERLATWGLTSTMPHELRDEAFDLWERHIFERGGGDHSSARLTSDRVALSAGPATGDKVPVRDENLRERFRVLAARFDIEGEVLGLWGMTSEMPQAIRAAIFDRWRERLERGVADGDGRRSASRLDADIERLDSLSGEPRA